ncbi:hypothetical protein H4R19_004018, partial [Coemansia spiralis]
RLARRTGRSKGDDADPAPGDGAELVGWSDARLHRCLGAAVFPCAGVEPPAGPPVHGPAAHVACTARRRRAGSAVRHHIPDCGRDAVCGRSSSDVGHGQPHGRRSGPHVHARGSACVGPVRQAGSVHRAGGSRGEAGACRVPAVVAGGARSGVPRRPAAPQHWRGRRRCPRRAAGL